MSIMSWFKGIFKPKPKKYRGSIFARGLMFNKIHVADYEVFIKHDQVLAQVLWYKYGVDISKAAYIQGNNTIAWNWTSEEIK
ncbi:hypothetical protein VP424E501_P0256 [Vibrio phage 424E50-1]|nr:hypothetical protein VP501E541_P0238 [Vibrio phage 501E54-1]CAH9014847.1 hypothetical protein VP424E501_P0256 [Vibrio phage 424E50-1]